GKTNIIDGNLLHRILSFRFNEGSGFIAWRCFKADIQRRIAVDYCVKFTVLDALELGYAVNVITDGCRGVNIHPQDSAHAFMEM
ncbi:isochorismatase family protein, partial [Salmonella enterica subsp. enterica serovar Kentucky]|nr:isochorismatase family protein [Salmonella enterica subsp. enterica serovar Kentucky]